MKLRNSLIAVAVATAVAAPLTAMADASMYGSVRLSVRGIDAGDDMKWNIANHSSRLGFKGSEELDNGLKAVAHYELGVNADQAIFATGASANRLSYVGLEGGFGGVYLGAQWTPFYTVVGGTTDQFNAVGANHIHSTVRTGDALAYAGTFGPATIIGAVVMTDMNETETDEIDIFQLGAQFNAGPVAVGIAVDQRAESAGDGTRFGLGATYSAGEMTFAAEFTSSEATLEGGTEDDDDVTGFEIYGGFGLGNGNLIHASFGQTDDGNNTPNSISLGYQKKLSKATRFWVEGMIDDPDTDADDTTTVSIGMRHDW
ncbi:MAG: porin [Gammaproteobacteria bacterium]|nr:porin [Gammaproteobacteria bacterium]